MATEIGEAAGITVTRLSLGTGKGVGYQLTLASGEYQVLEPPALVELTAVLLVAAGNWPDGIEMLAKMRELAGVVQYHSDLAGGAGAQITAFFHAARSKAVRRANRERLGVDFTEGDDDAL